MAQQYLLTSRELEFLGEEVLQSDEEQPQDCCGATHEHPAAHAARAITQAKHAVRVQGNNATGHKHGGLDGCASTAPDSQVATLPLSCSRALQVVMQLEQQLRSSDPAAAVSMHATLAQHYNSTAAQLLDAGQDMIARGLLEKAQVLCEMGNARKADNSDLLATTLSNLACYYKRAGDLQAALVLLQQAAQLEELQDGTAAVNEDQQQPGSAPLLSEAPTGMCSGKGSTAQAQTGPAPAESTVTGLSAVGPESIASTHLNLSTVLSALGRHSEAVQATRTALDQLCLSMGLEAADVVAWAVAPLRPLPIRQHARSHRPPRAWSGHSTHSMHSATVANNQRQSAAPNVWHEGKLHAGMPHVSKEGSAASMDDAAPSSCHSIREPTSVCSSTSSGGKPTEAEGLCHGVSGTGTRLAKLPKSTTRLLAMCAYNLAVEHEHMREIDEALHMYMAAACLATRLCGRDSSHAHHFKKTLQAFKAGYRQNTMRAYSKHQINNSKSRGASAAHQQHAASALATSCSSSSGVAAGHEHEMSNKSKGVNRPGALVQDQPCGLLASKPTHGCNADSMLQKPTGKANGNAADKNTHKGQKAMHHARTPLRAAYAPAAKHCAMQCKGPAVQATLPGMHPLATLHDSSPLSSRLCSRHSDTWSSGSQLDQQGLSSNSIGKHRGLDDQILAHKQKLHELLSICHAAGQATRQT